MRNGYGFPYKGGKTTFNLPACDRPVLIYKDTIEDHQFSVVELSAQLQNVFETAFVCVDDISI